MIVSFDVILQGDRYHEKNHPAAMPTGFDNLGLIFV